MIGEKAAVKVYPQPRDLVTKDFRSLSRSSPVQSSYPEVKLQIYLSKARSARKTWIDSDLERRLVGNKDNQGLT